MCVTTKFNRSWQNTTQATYKWQFFSHWIKDKHFSYFRGLSYWECSYFIVYQCFSLLIPFCTIYWTNLGLNTSIYETDHFRNGIHGDEKGLYYTPVFNEKTLESLRFFFLGFRGVVFQLTDTQHKKNICAYWRKNWVWKIFWSNSSRRKFDFCLSQSSFSHNE